MNKRLLTGLLVCAMTLNMAMPVFATESDSNGSASGTTTLSGEIEYTTAYTLTIPASINNMNLSQDAETTVGEVKVTKQNDNAEFDPAKKVSVTVSYDGELVNGNDSSKKVAYKLQQSKGASEVTDITTDSKLNFSASEIEAGNVAYNLKAIVTETNKSGGTYSGTISFSAQVESATISFSIKCYDKDDDSFDYKLYTYEVEAGTTWREFLTTDSEDLFYIDEEKDKVVCNYQDVWVVHESNPNDKVESDEVIIDNEIYAC